MRTPAAILLSFLIVGDAAWATDDGRPIPTMLCTCTINSAVGPCPSFFIRFNDDHSAQISRSGRAGSWSGKYSLLVTRETLSIAGDSWGEPRIGDLTINRATGRFESVIIENWFDEFNGWTNTGLCEAVPAQ